MHLSGVQTETKPSRVREGFRFVLTASAAEMGTYGNSWMKAMHASFPHMLARPFVSRYLKPWNMEDGTARFAPYGLRKIESILSEHYGENEVAVVHPDMLPEFVGERTEAVLISTMDPLGMAYVSTTYNPLIGFGGKALNRSEFERLMRTPVLRRPGLKKIVGGFGVWQIRDSGLQSRYGIDLLVAGECEEWLIPTLERLRSGELRDGYVRTSKLYSFEKVPAIRHASSFGAVEITRGCGRRCQFCSPDFRTKYDFPLEQVMKEVDINVRFGADSCYLVTEDVFLYGNDARFTPSSAALSRLFGAIAGHEGIREIAISHASLVPVLINKTLLDEITPLIIEKSQYRRNGERFIGVDVGIESGSASLMGRYMHGKSYPLPINEWPEIVVRGAGIFNDHDWYPMFTFVMGLPGEREEDVIASLELLDRLKENIIFYVPLLFVPLEEAILKNAGKASIEKLTDLQWEFLMECWRRNMRMWADSIYPFVKLCAIAFAPYFLLHHGRKAAGSLRRLLDFPPSSGLDTVVWKKCESDYCTGANPRRGR